MKNKQIFDTKLKESTGIRIEINTVHNKEMGKYAKLFKTIFNRKNTYKFIKDMIYYKGGWPTDETPARLESLAQKTAKAAYFLNYIGDDTFVKYCKQYGISITLENLVEETVGHNEPIKNEAQLDSDWYDIFNKQRPKDKRECFNELISIGCGLQEIICEAADEIKITNAGIVEKDCEIKKPNFVKVVNINASPNKQKQIEKIKKNSKEIVEVVDNV